MAVAAPPATKALTASTINPHVRTMQYAVRGVIPTLAGTIADELAADPSSHPFPEVVLCNLGNPMALGNKPFTYLRQLLALLEYPDLMEDETACAAFPKDAVAHAKALLAELGPGGLGAESDPKGIPMVRRHIAEYIGERDGTAVQFPVDPENLYLTDGSSQSIMYLLQDIVTGKDTGILIPTPQYPIYSALLALFDATLCKYYPDEEKAWALDAEELQRAVDEAKANGVKPKALVVINPGNPTGQVLPEDNIREIIKFSYDNNLVLFADEVYQDNIYDSAVKFISFRKVLYSMDPKYRDLELASFHSASKGLVGECGKRGGYMELSGFSPALTAQIHKHIQLLPPNTTGQIALDFTIHPPAPGSDSYELFNTERTEKLASLKRRAEMVRDAFVQLPGVTCNLAQGSMYVFPKITLPEKVHEAAKAEGVAADFLYCRSLLVKKGICMIQGSGFGQKDGTLHIRATILPLEEKMPKMIQDIKEHHEAFLAEYA